ncbi:MAG: shikimate dehydrogenase [Candidatus Aureabacteria bacterium]|nr:shikimate dehydrogenase [Candidatus Auribacterota bacterium]HOE27156.1 shikimate dehydrogenase [bacterium]HQM52056.1 shikimate dehydrogenase [bacterium]
MRRYAVIGWPLGHSMSPAVHNASFRALGLPCRFESIPVPPDGLDAFIRALPASGLRGLAVTIPHKCAVLARCATVAPDAAAIGAANTVTVGEDGGLAACNTDAPGALRALAEAKVAVAGARAVILGAGGAARAICWGLLRGGAASVAIANRTPARAERLRDDLARACGAERRIAVIPAAGPALAEAVASAGILVNATSVGMHPKTGESPIRREFLRPGLSVLEIVYNPIETRLLADARAAGAVAIPGMEMLLWQAAEQERVWLGVEAPVDEMREALLSGLGRSL